MKCFIVFDGDYNVRENIGFVKCDSKEEAESLIFKLIKANYGMGDKETRKYLDNNISFDELKNSILDDDKLDVKYAEGFNWMGNLKHITEDELEEGRKERDKLVEKLRQKV